MTNKGKLALTGGQPSCARKWPVWPVWDDAERKALNGVLESGKWWYGEKVRQFEAAFAAFQNARFGVTCNSGTTALQTALMALGVGEGDEIILPPYTFIATANTVVSVGGVPVFADILPNTLCLDPAEVERKISPRTKGIVPVHFAGHVADMDRLAEIAKKHKLFILEDACHSWGSQWKGKGAGALGECGVFSFQATKNISSAEGGIVLSDNEELSELCRSYTNVGRLKGSQWYDHEYLGCNLRMTEFQGALLLAQLTRLEKQTLKRQTNAELLDRELRGVPGICPLDNDPRMTRRSYHIYIFRVDTEKLGISVSRFIEALAAEGVPAYGGYGKPIYANGLFQKASQGRARHPIIAPFAGKGLDYSKVSCPVCEQVCQDAVWIWHNALLAEEDDMRAIAATVRRVVENIGELR
jgi:dTDP-4-amino-4,6-dideoxygalactose transaminase